MADEGVGYQLQNIMTNLAVRVGQLEGSLKTFMDNWATQDRLAQDSRRVVSDRIELLSRQVDRIATDVQNVQQDLAELKKEVDEQISPTIKTWQFTAQQKIGAKGVWAMVWAAIIAVGSIMAYLGDKAVEYFLHKP